MPMRGRQYMGATNGAAPVVNQQPEMRVADNRMVDVSPAAGEDAAVRMWTAGIVIGSIVLLAIIAGGFKGYLSR